MDSVEIYEHDKHYSLLTAWFDDYGMPRVEKADFPKLGVVIDRAVSGFLIQTDSSTCRIDNLIAKRGISPIDKKESFKMVITELSKMAKGLGFRFIEVSVNSEMLKLAMVESEFIIVGNYTLFAKRLGD
mgnify:CR=1 FL=1